MSGTQYQVIQTNFLLSQIVPTHTTPKKNSSKGTLKTLKKKLSFRPEKRKTGALCFLIVNKLLDYHMKIF